MIVRIAMFEVAPKEWSEPGMEVFLKWMASQPGFVRGNHLKNPKTGGEIGRAHV